MSGEGAELTFGGAAGLVSAAEWQSEATAAVTDPEHIPSPEAPTVESLITEEQVGHIEASRAEREALLSQAFEFARAQSQAEVAARYHLDGNILQRWVGKTRAYFAGEFADQRLSEKVAQEKLEGKDSTDIEQDLKKAYRLFSKEGGRRLLGKVGVKTGITTGIGAITTTILGGTIASPIFLGALIGGAAVRGAYELYRHLNPQEREARTRVTIARAEVYAKAAELEDSFQALSAERLSADPDRQAAIDQQIDAMHTYLIELTNYESYKMLDGDQEAEKELQGLAKVNELAGEKMRLEKKREKIADLLSAGGSVLGGLAGGFVQANLGAVSPTPEKLRGAMLDWNKDGVSHFVDKIQLSDLAGMDPGFKEALEKSGGYVFHYNAGELPTQLAAQVQTAILKDGSQVHVLAGMTDSLFRQLTHQLPNVAEHAAFLAGNFWKEAVPLAGAQLLTLFNFFGGGSSSQETVLETAAAPSPAFAVGTTVMFGNKEWRVGEVRPGPDPLYRLNALTHTQGPPYLEWRKASELSQPTAQVAKNGSESSYNQDQTIPIKISTKNKPEVQQPK